MLIKTPEKTSIFKNYIILEIQEKGNRIPKDTFREFGMKKGVYIFFTIEKNKKIIYIGKTYGSKNYEGKDDSTFRGRIGRHLHEKSTKQRALFRDLKSYGKFYCHFICSEEIKKLIPQNNIETKDKVHIFEQALIGLFRFNNKYLLNK